MKEGEQSPVPTFNAPPGRFAEEVEEVTKKLRKKPKKGDDLKLYELSQSEGWEVFEEPYLKESVRT